MDHFKVLTWHLCGAFTPANCQAVPKGPAASPDASSKLSGTATATHSYPQLPTATHSYPQRPNSSCPTPSRRPAALLQNRAAVRQCCGCLAIGPPSRPPAAHLRELLLHRLAQAGPGFLPPLSDSCSEGLSDICLYRGQEGGPAAAVPHQGVHLQQHCHHVLHLQQPLQPAPGTVL